MIEPKTVEEQLLFSTVRIETKNGVGTGFLFEYDMGQKGNVPVIVTNKHVLNYNDKETVIKFTLHYKINEIPSKDIITISYTADWYFHDTYDLAITLVNPLIIKIREDKKRDVFIRTVPEDIIWTSSILKQLSAVENVLMYGYPIGLYDEANILPIIRKGITASHPALDYNGQKIGVVDMACFPGSSGSPIFILEEGGYADKKKNTMMVGTRVILLGILYSGPIYNSRGQVIIQEIPTKSQLISEHQIMINLGYYIKAEVLLEMKEKIKKIVNI